MYHRRTKEKAVYQMAVIQRRGEKWRALVRLKGHPTLSTNFNGKKAAQAQAKLTENALKAGKTAPEASMTLADLIDRYIKEMVSFKPMSTAKRGNLTRWKETTGHKEVALLTPEDILDHVAKRSLGENGARSATMVMEVRLLGEVLVAASSLWNINIPDVVAFTHPTLRRKYAVAKPQERYRRPTADETKALADQFHMDTTFRRARKQIENMYFHQLRHKDTSQLFEQDYGTPEAAIVTGHRNWKSLMRHTNLQPASLHRMPTP